MAVVWPCEEEHEHGAKSPPLPAVELNYFCVVVVAFAHFVNRTNDTVAITVENVVNAAQLE
jgi:hypothetical protein